MTSIGATAVHVEHAVHDEPTPASIRARLLELTDGVLPSAQALGPPPRALPPRGPLPSVAYLLPGLPPEGSGGSHSLVQEARGLRRLGARARVCVPQDSLATAIAVYGNDDELFAPYPEDSGISELGDTSVAAGLLHAIGDARVLVATEYPSVDLLARLARARPGIACAYYVQDYEPLFAPPESSRADRALLSYRALPQLLPFAKTHWLCNLLREVHGVAVAKVAPSLDRELFHAGGRSQRAGALRVAAMIRPRTPRRRPLATLDALTAIARELGDGVRIATFGCAEESFASLRADGHEAGGDGARGDGGDRIAHLGLLSRMQVSALMRRCDIFIDGSAYQAFGRTGLEAMACGAVPLLPALGGVHEYARDGGNAVILADGDPEEIVAAVVALAGDPARLARLSAAGVADAQRFSIERAARSQLALFAQASA
ncbi:MAG TPA: glycosyltransferase family 4 protein [Solirubrobacteraceae bacterium]|jgi:glycosyltransferase involved in cell wall biosynthesis|nr:glycosyltransferase family 4 protein [Solirubrobacteraceae bacterium]